MKRIGVLTSGGDAPGMNAAVRAVVRTALDMGAEVFAIYEGYQGMVDGGKRIVQMSWRDVGGILGQGGTIIGTTRCDAFRTRDGRRQAAYNLIKHEIDSLVVIGGDGSLGGANILRQEWASLLQELVEQGKLSAKIAKKHQLLTLMGLPGSIDNDLCGTDMTIGADTALHRICDAVDAITSTAASHQRSFVVEVMGRRCGYLALMSAMATGADWVLIPESPPNLDNWEDKMCEVLRKGREIGRRDSIVIVAEGAQDRKGNPISSGYVRQVLEDRLGEDARVTILGHVQRGGSPSVYDRNLSTLLGNAAVQNILSGEYEGEAHLMGIRNNKINAVPLAKALVDTNALAEALNKQDFNKAMNLRGNSFKGAFRIVRTLVRAIPHDPEPGKPRLRLAVMNAGAPAPGMNTAIRALIRIGIDRGHILLGVKDGFRGLSNGHIEEMGWMSVNGWAHTGGAGLGTNRYIPEGRDYYHIARSLEEHKIDGLIVVGGSTAYEAALQMYERRNTFPAFDLPILCVPATIDNDLAGSELSIGADTALNNIVDAVDKIKQSAVALRRVFVVEVMGRKCGYLALMSALASGAERVYLHEEGLSLKDLQADVEELIHGFQQGKPLGLVIRNENVNPTYTTPFISSLFQEEGEELYTVRQAILGHLQQGGNPSPFDRILATRLASNCLSYIEDHLGDSTPISATVGLTEGKVRFTELRHLPEMMDMTNGRPKEQWWLSLRPIARVMAKPGPNGNGDL